MSKTGDDFTAVMCYNEMSQYVGGGQHETAQILGLVCYN